MNLPSFFQGCHQPPGVAAAARAASSPCGRPAARAAAQTAHWRAPGAGRRDPLRRWAGRFGDMIS